MTLDGSGDRHSVALPGDAEGLKKFFSCSLTV